jgi:hypothetical protein
MNYIPFRTDLEQIHSVTLLLRDITTGLEGCVYLLIHLDKKIVLDLKLLITDSDLFCDPILEGIANYGGSKINYPLLVNFAHLSSFWKVALSLSMQSNLTPDIRYAQVLVLRDKAVANVFAFHVYNN